MNRRDFARALALLAAGVAVLGRRAVTPDAWPTDGVCRVQGGPCDGEVFVSPQVTVGSQVMTPMAAPVSERQRALLTAAGAVLMPGSQGIYELRAPAVYEYAGDGQWRFLRPTEG